MESIRNTLSEMMKNNRFQSTFSKVKSEIDKNDNISAFITEHSIPETTVQKGLAKLYEYDRQQKNCQNCQGFEKCPNVMQGYSPQLVLTHGVIDIQYSRCPLKEKHDEEQRQKKLFESLYIPKEVVGARFSQLDIDADRVEAIQLAEQYVSDFVPGETKHGLYFYGDFGVGKTFLLCAIANELALLKNVKSLIVYTPDFFRDLRSAIGQDTFHEKLNYVKQVPFLILDDIGSESISAWIRDEVLGSILQYRMMEGLPTLYSSNYDYAGLEDHLAYSEKAGTELLKAKRIMERIRHYTASKFIGGSNRRENLIRK